MAQRTPTEYAIKAHISATEWRIAARLRKLPQTPELDEVIEELETDAINKEKLD
jgi:hypothetical protein